jgi:hypothetical protein
MKKIAVVSLALAVLATTPALARARQQQEGQSSGYGQVQSGFQSGYYRPSQVPSGDVPFAPF